MALHEAALFLIRKRMRALIHEIESSREDTQYNSNTEEYYVQPLERELKALEESKQALEYLVTAAEARKRPLPTKAFDLNTTHIGYYLESEHGARGRILDVKVIETSDGRDNWSTCRVEVELDEGDGPFNFPVTNVFAHNTNIELSTLD